jgi:hypothetical protein
VDVWLLTMTFSPYNDPWDEKIDDFMVSSQTTTRVINRHVCTTWSSGGRAETPLQDPGQFWPPSLGKKTFRRLEMFGTIFKWIILFPCLYSSLFNTQTMHINSIMHNSIAMFPKNIMWTLAGFEPGCSVPGANAMTNMSRRQGIWNIS